MNRQIAGCDEREIRYGSICKGIFDYSGGYLVWDLVCSLRALFWIVLPTL